MTLAAGHERITLATTALAQSGLDNASLNASAHMNNNYSSLQRCVVATDDVRTFASLISSPHIGARASPSVSRHAAQNLTTWRSWL